MPKYRLLLKNGYVVDPVNNREGHFDVGIQDGKIAAVEKDIDIKYAEEVLDLKGKLCVPGIIDTHAHVSVPSLRYGYRMLAKAGVTTVFDVMGPIDNIINDIHEWGAGINIAALNAAIPGKSVSSEAPSKSEIQKFVDESLESGALGIKLLGGHFPLTPETTREFICEGNKRKAYVAYHCGTTNAGSNIGGLEEAIELAKGQRLHIAHINSYCRGTVHDSLTEVSKALSLLKGARNIVSEAYLGPNNCTLAESDNGELTDHVTRRCLSVKNYPTTEAGVIQAISDGYAVVNRLVGDEVRLIGIEDGLEYYMNHKDETDVAVSFPVNSRDTAFLCATAKGDNGDFIVDAISTDGGGLPRNFIISKGLLLVKFNALTLKEFVQKTSTEPARMLGLVNKGHLTNGADADITVIDYDRSEPFMTLVAGKINMYDKVVFGKSGTIITTEKGKKRIENENLPYQVVDINNTLLYTK